jgi:isopentenyl-diphosphate delta-isomerase
LGNSDDQIICVDIFDQPVGTMNKIEAHQKGVLHRAFSVFLLDPGGSRMLIQQRAGNKYHSGGLWANTCCSHPRAGENTALAARRRLKEETGIDCHIEEVFSFVYREVYPDGLSEYEYDHVFLGLYEGAEADWQPDPEEIQAMQWIDIKELAQQLCSQPERFSAWFIIAAPKVIEFINKKNDAPVVT